MGGRSKTTSSFLIGELTFFLDFELESVAFEGLNLLEVLIPDSKCPARSCLSYPILFF